MKHILNINRAIVYSILIIIFAPGCKKLVEVETPNNRVLKETIFSNNIGSIGYINQCIIDITAAGFLGSSRLNALPFSTGLAGDELILVDPSSEYGAHYLNQLTASTIALIPWSKTYSTIYSINDAIEGISQSASLLPTLKTQLLGEAKFLRAFCYFYLTNLYGDVPLITYTDYKLSSTQGRDNQIKVYQQILEDLKDAENLLSDEFLDGTLLNQSTEKLRPTKWAAKALLAKVYLYNKNWQLAEQKSGEVISNTSLFGLDSLNNVFLSNSKEAIWQTQPNSDAANTENALVFILPPSGPDNYFHPVYLSNNLLNSFEPGDKRKETWIGNSTDGVNIFPYPFKYKVTQPPAPSAPFTEYYMILRLGEQYLIRAEARVQQNNLNGALSDLNIIRNRAGLENSTTSTKNDILNAIFHERQVELFVEWGDRWFDLIRSGKIDEVMSKVAIQKGSKWSSYRKLYPIPAADIFVDNNLKQNPGY